MKIPIYLRIAKTNGRKGYKVAATTNPSNEPLSTAGARGSVEYHPTVSFCVVMDVADALFEQSERVIAELNVAMKDALVTGEIALPKGISVKTK